MSTNFEQVSQRLDRLEIDLEDALQRAFNKHDASTERIINSIDVLKTSTAELSTSVSKTMHQVENSTKVMYVTAVLVAVLELIRTIF